ncbi:MAG TPA: DUF418 domain-containing protein [Gemmatimonadales bacterium]|nr:DUF418 domain-containing protein [Gemmatimonadales bacterium]
MAVELHHALEPASSVPAPISTDDRLHTLDILRGLALFGMILVHFHQKMRIEVTGLEDLIAWGVWILVEQKAWGIFAFLFGVGFAVLLRRLEARNAPVVPIYLRRLAGLAVFGLIAQVGFGFHVLLEYAAWGLVLLVIRRWSTPAVLATALVAVFARPVTAALTAAYAWSTGGSSPAPVTTALRQAAEATAENADYLALLWARWALFVGGLPHGWRDLLPDTNLALFCLGLLAVRHGVLDQPLRHRRLIIGWMIFGAVAWAAHWLVLKDLPELPVAGATWPVSQGLGLLNEQWLCLTYIGAVVLLLAYRPAWTRRLRAVGSAGRMALTNYMLQVAVLDALASGYGLGLKLRPAAYVLAAVLLFSAEAAFSTAWLARFRFGPLEWLWRMITYARPQRLRRAPSLRSTVAHSS